MTHTLKTSVIGFIVVSALALPTAALAGELKTNLPWSADKTVEQNYKSAKTSAKGYCRISVAQAGISHPKDRAAQSNHCVRVLMNDFVKQKGTPELVRFHANATGKTIRKIQKYAQK